MDGVPAQGRREQPRGRGRTDDEAARSGHLTAPTGADPGRFPDGRPTTSSLLQLASYVITLIVVVGPGVGVWFLTESIVLTVITVVELAALLVLLRARTGVTPGGLVLGLRAARRTNHLAPGLSREAARSGILGGSHVTVVGGLVLSLSGLFDPQKRGRAWHDRVGRTRVLPARRIAKELATEPDGGRRVRATMAPLPADRIDLGRQVTRLGDDPRHGSGTRRD
ncbi:RDD family protein [Georgenia sp. Z1344]|uniref:RDD family protein n=1 Tax=Georgenia sp. Z1344 TaxID=3416706 RepID=UPI003CF4BFE9